MKLLDILKRKEELFIIDDIEDKKTKTILKDVNTSLIHLVYSYEEFKEFSEKQLSGEYNQKLVHAKSLLNSYPEWLGIKQAYAVLKKEEEDQIAKVSNEKKALIEKLHLLINDCQKLLPILAMYHISNSELVTSKPEHATIIIGNYNTNIINKIISELENEIVLTGHFEEIVPVELKANYATVENNVTLCKDKIESVYSNKHNKADKLYALVEKMETAAQKLVFFETCKPHMINVGCSTKDIDLLEKDLLKKYVPLKKHLQKGLKLQFEDISSIVVDESDFNIENSNDEKNNNLFDDDIFSDLDDL